MTGKERPSKNKFTYKPPDLSSKEPEELIDMYLNLQLKMQDDVSQIHKARRKTLQYDEELRQVEQEITLLLDEREYAYTSAWTDEITKDSPIDPFIAERISTLNQQAKMTNHQLNTLNKYANKQMTKEKLPKYFEFPMIIRRKLEELTNELADLRQIRDTKKIATLTEDILGNYVIDHKEDANLLTDALKQIQKEQIGLLCAIDRKQKHLDKLLTELSEHGFMLITDSKRVWKLIPRESLHKGEKVSTTMEAVSPEGSP